MNCDFIAVFPKSDMQILLERIEKLEQGTQALLASYEQTCEFYRKEIRELKRFQDVTHEQYKKNMKGKMPYKCPLCDGKVLSEIKIQKTESGRDKLVLECHACEGKGIVWG